MRPPSKIQHAAWRSLFGTASRHVLVGSYFKSVLNGEMGGEGVLELRIETLSSLDTLDDCLDFSGTL